MAIHGCGHRGETSRRASSSSPSPVRCGGSGPIASRSFTSTAHRGAGLVVEPVAALGQVAEAQRAAGGKPGHGAAGAVRAAAHRVRERVPAVEVPDHRHRPGRLVGGQHEGDPDFVALAGSALLDHGPHLRTWQFIRHRGCRTDVSAPCQPLNAGVNAGSRLANDVAVARTSLLRRQSNHHDAGRVRLAGFVWRDSSGRAGSWHPATAATPLPLAPALPASARLDPALPSAETAMKPGERHGWPSGDARAAPEGRP